MIAAFNKRAQRIAREMYPTMVTDKGCQEQFAQFLQLVVHADSAILFHCTQGKDRTGLASAYILSALGVDRETIIKDFDATNVIYAKEVKRISRRIRFLGGKDKELETVKAFIGANTDNFINALDLIDSEYGSMSNYLQGPLGLSEEDIRLLKEHYLQAVE
jgi:protein-tyrosine phosphatase